jgi:2-polyprenyl-3-methyl-5-hydroxy-6-metoxy-1,4-benzoquinol methylase
MTSGIYVMKDHAGSSHRVILGLLEELAPGSRVLDVGVATGYLDREMKARGLRVTGIERDPVSADQARPYCDELLIGDVEALDLAAWAGNFDVVVLADILEHLKDPAATLAKVVATARPGARVIACVPNVANLYVRLNLLAGRFQYAPRGILDATHLRFFTRRTFITLIESAGLRISELRATPIPLPEAFPRSAGSWWIRLSMSLLRGVTPMFKGLMAYQFVIAAGKPGTAASVNSAAKQREVVGVSR